MAGEGGRAGTNFSTLFRELNSARCEINADLEKGYLIAEALSEVLEVLA